jgi:ATP-binding cassette subfamily F protein 3
MISHDREFLNKLVGSIIEIAHRKLTRYRGNWDSYIEQKAAREEQQWAAYKNQQKEIATLQEFADRFRAKASKASQAQSKLKQIDRMEKIEAPAGNEKTVSFRFPLPVQQGERSLGYNVKVGYFAQYRTEMLNPKQTVLESVLDCENPVSEQTARTVLGSFLFRDDDVFKPTAVLSGGEKTRVALVKLLLDPPNVLLMDEPTTHLDIGSIDALISALKQYEGTLIFISHDVHFIRAIATTVLHISAGRLTMYPGDYQYYLDKSKAGSERGALIAGDKLQNAQPAGAAAEAKAPALGMKEMREQRRAEADKRKAEAKALRDKQKEADQVEMRILTLEGRQKEITAELEKPDAYDAGGNAVQLNRELMSVTEELEKLMATWEGMAGR